MTNKQTIESLLKGRRTIHEFDNSSEVDISIIKQGFDLARFAPNHHLTEPWHFYLLGPETKDAICELNYELLLEKKGEVAAEKKRQRWREIPGWALVSCDQCTDPIQLQEDYAAVACAIHNFSLFLWQNGIGSKWSTGPVIRDPRMYELTWIDPDVEYIVALLWYGYPKEIPTVARSEVDSCLVELP